MDSYLLTFLKFIPMRQQTVKTEYWYTTIIANGEIDAKQKAVRLGSMLRIRLAKGYDIKLDSVEIIN